jgi:3-oxoacyl-[acyl-carrier protein] reductase
MLELKDKLALIPGASRPIGRAVARKFARNGARLLLPVFDWPESIEEMQNEFTEQGWDFTTISADLRCESEVLRIRKAIEQTGKGLDFLINNIERGGMPVVHGSYDLPHNANQWDREINTTMKAKWLLFHHCFPLMQAGETEKSAVVNISSVAAETGRSGAVGMLYSDGYSAANRSIRSMTEEWAREAAPGIRVNELMLGLSRGRHGEGTRGWAALEQEKREEILNEVLLRRTAFPEEVADAVYFLAVQATYMTGSVVKMDGGLSLGARRVPPMPKSIL